MAKPKKYNGEPYDSTNSTNPPWLLNSNKKELIIDPNNGEPLTADYIWSQVGEDRKQLVERVFDYYRNNVSFEELISPNLSNKQLKAEFAKLVKLDSSSCINNAGEIKNSNSTCTNVLKQFSGDLFYSSKGGTKSSRSCRAVYEDDEALRCVLKNRMGWKSTGEDGSNRPYVFAMSDKMLVQGMRSSGLAYTVSTFKPAIAKYIYSEVITENMSPMVFDFSAGWGARALGAGSLGLEYWGIDPLTHVHINGMMKSFDLPGKVINGCSESSDSYLEIIEAGLRNKFNFAFSSPPYFTLEHYSEDENQSANKFDEYESWLINYWKPTVENVQKYVLERGRSKFAVAIVAKVKKHNIADDMISICEQSGLRFNKLIPWKTSKSHLSGKRKTGEIQKTTEGIYVFDW